MIYEETSGTSPREIREDSTTVLAPSWGNSWGSAWGNSWGIVYYPLFYESTTGAASNQIYEED